MRFHPLVHLTIEKALQLAGGIPEERRATLAKIAEYIVDAEEPELVFICTHNSRRSHLGQVWAKVFADAYGFSQVKTYSGGTEETACHPNTLNALQSQGFDIFTPEGENPKHELQYNDQGTKIICWSKKYDAPENPKDDFVAIMTCDSADQNCPLIPGAYLRIPCTYIDPKVSDGTDQQDATYKERSLQIASEMAWTFSYARQLIEPPKNSCCSPDSGCC